MAFCWAYINLNFYFQPLYVSWYIDVILAYIKWTTKDKNMTQIFKYIETHLTPAGFIAVIQLYFRNVT